MDATFLAVDLGASSGRVFVGAWDGDKFKLDELHRFPNCHVNVLNSMHWDVLRLWADIKDGFRCYSRDYTSAPVGIGIDAWGVDFALLDRSGSLLGNPHCYRDTRTLGMPEQVFARASSKELFECTGIQSWQINTLFQLFSMASGTNSQLQAASTLLMIPDLFSYWLSGEKAVEFTVGTTSQMLLKDGGSWAYDLLTRLEITTGILPSVVMPCNRLGKLRGDIVEEVRFRSAPTVFTTAAHDTASAVAAIPDMDIDSVFISSGTWSLMGIETSAPIVGKQAFEMQLTNEGGVGGSVLLLRNVTGLWLLQECMREWHRRGSEYTWDELMESAAKSKPFLCMIDPDDPAFIAPVNMPAAIRLYCVASGQPGPETPGEIARCCLESLSLRYRLVFEGLQLVAKRRFSKICVVGGGSKNKLLCQFTADACNRPVVTGPIEASGLGNIIVQAIAAGYLANLEEARRSIARSVQQITFEPRHTAAWADACAQFKELLQHQKARSQEVGRRPKSMPLPIQL